MTPTLQQLLRESFVQEVTERLPRIEAMLDLDAVRRDAHTLASSACVVQEPDLARLARAVELDLAGGPHAELVSHLQAFLRRYAP